VDVVVVQSWQQSAARDVDVRFFGGGPQPGRAFSDAAAGQPYVGDRGVCQVVTNGVAGHAGRGLGL